MADKQKLSFNRLLMNNKFVFVISLLSAIALWAIVSMTVAGDETRVIENVRIMLEDNEDSNYKMFGYEEKTVDVTVKGKKYLVSPGALSASDILVTASNNYVDSAGVKTLKLTASIEKSQDIKITSLSKSNIDVFFDVPKTVTLPVEAEIKAEGDIVPEGYIYEDPILPVSSVSVIGPATEINRIEKFKAVIEIKEPLKTTKEIEVALSAVTSDGKKTKYTNFENLDENLTATLPVSKIKEIPVSVRYVDIPSYYENNMPEVNIYPKTLKVAAAESVLESLDSLNVGTISFSDLTNTNNKFSFALEKIEEVRILDDVNEVEVNINCYPMRTKTFSVEAENITLLNTPDSKYAEILTAEISDITVVGPQSEINKLEKSDILAKVDLKKAKGGTENFKAVVYIKDNDKCWVYGKYYVKVMVK